MLIIDVLDNCNLRCPFCLPDAAPNTTSMALGDFKRIIAQCVDTGMTSVNLTPMAGEFFLHPQCYEMLAEACTYMLQVVLYSNLTVLDIDKLKAVPNLRHLDLVVSNYGDTKEVWVKITNSDPKWYDSFVANKKALREANIFFAEALITDDQINKGPLAFDPNKKCHKHQNPVVTSEQDVYFCNILPGNGHKPFATLKQVTVGNALTDPTRFEFYQSQKVCATCKEYEPGEYMDIKSLQWLATAKGRRGKPV